MVLFSFGQKRLVFQSCMLTSFKMVSYVISSAVSRIIFACIKRFTVIHMHILAWPTVAWLCRNQCKIQWLHTVNSSHFHCASLGFAVCVCVESLAIKLSCDLISLPTCLLIKICAAQIKSQHCAAPFHSIDRNHRAQQHDASPNHRQLGCRVFMWFANTQWTRKHIDCVQNLCASYRLCTYHRSTKVSTKSLRATNT